MSIVELSELVSLTRPTAVESVSGTTASRESAMGRRRIWTLRLSALSLPLWDTVWSTAEREIVLGALSTLPDGMPTALGALIGRRRLTINSGENRDWDTATVRLVLPDATGWPRFQRCTYDELMSQACGERYVGSLSAAGVERLGTKEDLLEETGRSKNELCAFLDRESHEAGPVLFLVSRVVPVARAVGLLD